MARIGLITSTLNDQTLNFARSLKAQHHEVILITSKKIEISEELPFQVLQFFKTWSPAESFQFFMRTLPLGIEIWHFLYAEDEFNSPTMGHWCLAQMARTLPGRVVAASFYQSVPTNLNSQLLTKSIDILTTSCREDLMDVKRRSWLGKFTETEVMPPQISRAQKGKDFHQASPDEDIQKLVQQCQPFLFAPSPRSMDVKKIEVTSDFNFLFHRKRPKSSSPKMFFTGTEIGNENFLFICQNASALLLAFQEIPLTELYFYHQLSTIYKVPVIANQKQAEFLPGLCIEKRNGFIVNSKHQLQLLLTSNPNLDLSSPFFELIPPEVIDTSINELNRLYVKVRQSKTASLMEPKWQK